MATEPNGIGPGAREENAGRAETEDVDPDHVILCHRLAGWLKDQLPDDVHAQVASKLRALPALAAAGKIPQEGRVERGQLRQEGPDGLPEAVKAAMDRLPRYFPTHIAAGPSSAPSAEASRLAAGLCPDAVNLRRM